MGHTNSLKFDALPQRQKKFARTKTSLLHALLVELESKPLAEILIKELCKAADVSEPTFFNYFDSKHHMLVYFIQLWSIEMNALAIDCEAESQSHTGIIKDIFIKTAEQIVKHPRLMLEVIAFQAQNSEMNPHTVTDGERWLFFDSIPNVENLESMGLESILPPLIDKAVVNGELSKNIDQEILFLTLSSLFMGTSLLVLQHNPESLPKILSAELDMIFSRSEK